MADASKITATTSARQAAYQAKVQTALPYLKVARSIGCSTGLHYGAFLNIVGVPAFDGGMWSIRSTNRLIKYAQDHGLIDWHRHRGRRNPGVEAKRIRMFATAVISCQDEYQASIQPNGDELQEDEADSTTETVIASHNQQVAVLA
jgi:hypothetical protein